MSSLRQRERDINSLLGPGLNANDCQSLKFVIAKPDAIEINVRTTKTRVSARRASLTMPCLNLTRSGRLTQKAPHIFRTEVFVSAAVTALSATQMSDCRTDMSLLRQESA